MADRWLVVVVQLHRAISQIPYQTALRLPVEQDDVLAWLAMTDALYDWRGCAMTRHLNVKRKEVSLPWFIVTAAVN